MPGCETLASSDRRHERAAKIKANLIAKGLDPRSLKFSEVFIRKMLGK